MESAHAKESRRSAIAARLGPLRPAGIGRTIAITLVAWTLLALPANADLLLTTETHDLSGRGASQRSGRIWLAADRIRMEFAGNGAGSAAIVVFRGDRELYWALDPIQKQYVQIDRETMAQLGERVRATRREMAAKLEQMAPEDRPRAREMMADFLPPETAPTNESVRPTETRRTLSGLETQRSELVQEGRVVGEVFAAPLAAIGISREQLSAFTALARFQRELMQTLGSAAGGSFGEEPFEIFDQLDGFPLLIRRLQQGAVQSETRFGLPEQVPDDASRYALPAGYSRRSGPGSAP